MQPARHPRGRRALVHAALAGLLTTIVFALAQCTMVEDQLTNVDPFRGRGSRCIRECKDAFKDSLKAERKLHRQNLRACGVRDDDDDDDDDRDDDARAGDVVRRRGNADLLRGRGDDGDDRDRDGRGGRDRDHGDRDDDQGERDDEDDEGEECEEDDDDDSANGGDSECVRAENRRHCEALQRIKEGRKECIRNCHHQGGGHGG